MKPGKPTKTEKTQIVKISKPAQAIATRRELAMSLHSQVLLGVFVSAQALFRIWEEKFWVDLGFETFGEYIQEMLPMSRGHVYINIKIARRFTPFTQSQNSNISSLESDNSLQITNEFGMNKLREMSYLEDDDFNAIMGGEKLNLKDGTSFDLADLREMVASSAQDALVKYRKEKREEIARLEESNRALKAENKDFQSRLEVMDAKVKGANEKEKLYGPRAVDITRRRQAIKNTMKLLDDAIHEMFSIRGDENDPENFQCDIQAVIKKIDMFHNNAFKEFSYVLRVD